LIECSGIGHVIGVTDQNIAGWVSHPNVANDNLNHVCAKTDNVKTGNVKVADVTAG
jgi:hypothetical protein